MVKGKLTSFSNESRFSPVDRKVPKLYPLDFWYPSCYGKAIRLTHVLAASFASLIAAVAASRYRKQVSTVVLDNKIIPKVNRSESGRIEKIEIFSHYVGISAVIDVFTIGGTISFSQHESLYHVILENIIIVYLLHEKRYKY